MKKIAFRISNDFSAHFASDFIQKKLKASQIEPVLFQVSADLPSESFQGLVLITNTADSALCKADILRFHQESKPLIVFLESAKYAAQTLKQHHPVIAVREADPDIAQLNKMQIDTEVCPMDDFITDRFTKILSTTIPLSETKLNPAIEKGLQSLCKELVEMC